MKLMHALCFKLGILLIFENSSKLFHHRRSIDYGQSCDWWSVGVILYEMLVGQPPFLAQTATDTQIRVVQWYRYLKVPGEPRLKPAARSLICQFLRDPNDRLADPNQIKAHSFFSSINWEQLPTQKAPYIPTVCSVICFSSLVTNFVTVTD